MTGHSGDDLIISVPKGTMVYDEISGALIGDLIQIGQRLVICQGGRGGKGNAHYATSRNQVPRHAERGSPSEEKHLRLELKLLADVGIIGVPNAGKSTLLSVLTNAKPKIGSFPFTTLEPNLGVLDIDDQTTLVIADLPGLIEGAHKGIGLGHNFLRHIQRTKILIHLLDGNAENPLADFSQINSELALFDINLRKKPQIIAINKIDLPQVRSRLTELEQQLIKRDKNRYLFQLWQGQIWIFLSKVCLAK